MSLKEKMQRYILSKKQQMQRGIEVTQQMKAERMRRKIQNARHLQPGTMKYGLFHRQNPLEFMTEAYDVRKKKRDMKTKNKDPEE